MDTAHSGAIDLFGPDPVPPEKRRVQSKKPKPVIFFQPSLIPGTPDARIEILYPKRKRTSARGKPKPYLKTLRRKRSGPQLSYLTDLPLGRAAKNHDLTPVYREYLSFDQIREEFTDEQMSQMLVAFFHLNFDDLMNGIQAEALEAMDWIFAPPNLRINVSSTGRPDLRTVPIEYVPFSFMFICGVLGLGKNHREEILRKAAAIAVSRGLDPLGRYGYCRVGRFFL